MAAIGFFSSAKISKIVKNCFIYINVIIKLFERIVYFNICII